MKTTEELLEENGWSIECQSPFEIRHVDGSFASGNAARRVIDSFCYDVCFEKLVILKESFKNDFISESEFLKEVLKVIS